MKKRTDKIRNGKSAGIAIGITATVMCFCTVGIYAMADTRAGGTDVDGPSSNLWLSVVDISAAPRISVTVPMAYSFMVSGSTEDADSRPVTIDNGSVQLGKTVVWDEENAVYDIVTEDSRADRVEFKNYSTEVEMLDAGNTVRKGAYVSVQGHLMAEKSSALTGTDTWWKPVAEDPTGDSEKFKCYRLGIGDWFDQSDPVSIGGSDNDALTTKERLTLAPPDASGGFDVGGTAKNPQSTYFNISLQVGGVRNNYNVPEESAKAGRIIWNVKLEQ